MGLYNKLPDDIREVDVIVAGGGSAGCVVASRLAEADPKLSILLIEQGINNYNVPEVVHPALFPRNLRPRSKTALFWQGNKSPQLANQSPIVPSGGCLGGGSSINWMVYTRGSRSDYEWNQPGWSANEILPFLNKLETYHGQGEKDHHGFNGPINISGGTFRSKRAENDFIEAAAKVGYPELKDLQNLDANNATERWLRYVGLDGQRQDAAHRYLHPKLQSGDYPNLHVLVENQVVRVLFDENKKANAVEFQPNAKLQGPGGSKNSIGARKLVILSSGANATPLILERSGIGDPEVLKRAGVPVVEALRDVGEHYQDHHLTLYAYRTDLSPRETINGFDDGRFGMADIQEMIKNKDELLGWNSMDASGKFRPTDAEVQALGPEFEAAWKRDFQDAKDRPLMIIAMYLSYFGDHSILPEDSSSQYVASSSQYVSMANWTAYPYSRGHIHITGKSLGDPIDFDVGYLKDENDIDVKKHIWAYKIQREIFRRMSIFRGELQASHPRFPAGSKAAVIEQADGPVPDDAGRIEYSAEDDKAIEQKVREIVATTWHSLGTCRMGPKEEGGVIGPDLGVHGVKNLKLSDLSVPPFNVGANTNNTALMIGEKAADIFIRELGLGGANSKL